MLERASSIKANSRIIVEANGLQSVAKKHQQKSTVICTLKFLFCFIFQKGCVSIVNQIR